MHCFCRAAEKNLNKKPDKHSYDDKMLQAHDLQFGKDYALYPKHILQMYAQMQIQKIKIAKW